MPCPFAPLLSLIPALPFIPWVIGKSMEKIGRRQSLNISSESLAKLSNQGVTVEKEALIICWPATEIGSFEYYATGAPYIRKSKSIQAISVEGEGLSGEILLFTGLNDLELVKNVSNLLAQFKIMRAVYKNNKLTIKGLPLDFLKEEELKSFLEKLSSLDLSFNNICHSK